MAEAEFDLVYDGPALRDGTMPVRELAPALLALGDAFAQASQVVYPDRPPVALNIRATGEGSFLIHLFLHAKDGWDRAVDLFTSDEVSGLANLQSLLFASGSGLVWFLKRKRDRVIVTTDPAETPGTITVSFDDGATIEVPAAVLELYNHLEIRRSVRQTIAPLERQGIDEVRIRVPSVETETIRDDDLPAFELPVSDDPSVLTDQEISIALEVVSPEFEEGRKWRFSDGQSRFTAAVTDDNFVERVERGVLRFGKGDILRARLRIKQVQRPTGGLRTEREVVRVIEHVPSPVQLELGPTDDAPELGR